jgi:hypothetical protein
MQLRTQHAKQVQRVYNRVISDESLGMFVNGVRHWRMLWEASN